MARSLLDNRRVMRQVLNRDLAQNSLVLFPELALTGFHRGLKEVTVQGDIEESCVILQEYCDEKQVSIVFGTPWFFRDGIRNAAVYLAPKSRRQVAAKIGLTESERGFFTPGNGRPVLNWNGLRFSIIFCREVLDHKSQGLGLGDNLDFILWPGYIAWSDDAENYVQAAKAIAKDYDCGLYQCNWPMSLNDPEQRDMGGSHIIDQQGEVLKRAAFDESDLLKFQF